MTVTESRQTISAQQRWGQVMMDNYGTPPLAIRSASGVRVVDLDGREYLDFVGGIAVSALGHCHPALVSAITTQASTLMHTSNLLMHEPGLRLAERLTALMQDDSARVFFSNDGATANECAIKIARLHGRQSDPTGNRMTLVSTENSFHGRTMGALSITGNASKREPFEPLPGPVKFIPYGDVDALRAVVDSSVSAVFLEPTQGEGGIVPAPAGYLQAARQICDEAGALLVIDEVQSGIGRTGEWLVSVAEGIKPDVVTLAKGLGGGLPIGACIATGNAATLLTPGTHGSTFGGNPVSCAAALAVLDTIESEDLLANVKTRGDVLRRGLAELGSPLVSELRGAGLWWGVVLNEAVAAEVEVAAREHGLLVNAVKPDVIRLAPPLIVTEPDIAAAVAGLQAALSDVAQRAGS